MIKLKLRRATQLEWTTQNPILASGEPGFEKDTGKLKIGNGINTWNNLDYFVSENESEILLLEHIDSILPHPVYDDGPSLTLLYENAKV